MADIFNNRLFNLETPHIFSLYPCDNKVDYWPMLFLTLWPSQVSQDGEGQNIQTLALYMYKFFRRKLNWNNVDTSSVPGTEPNHPIGQ